MEEKEAVSSESKPKADVITATSVIPFSSIAMVAVMAILRPDHLQDILQLGMDTFGVSKVTMIVGSVIGSILVLILSRLMINQVRHMYHEFTNWRDDKASLEKERLALIKLFESLGGKCWKDKTRWCSNEPVNRWKGVKVDPHNGHVNKLILPNNNLAGKIPGEALLDLPYLIELDFRENKIAGTIPSELGELPNLEGLYLFDNYLEGKIPRSLLSLPRLSGIYLFSNSLQDVDSMREEFKAKITDGYVFI